MHETFGQQYAFLFMVSTGFFAGAVIHLCLKLESLMRAGRLLTLLTDFVCVLLVSLLLLFSMLFSVRLEFRLYIFLSAALGTAAYFYFASPIAEKIVHFVRKIFDRLYRSDNLKKICQILCK